MGLMILTCDVPLTQVLFNVWTLLVAMAPYFEHILTKTWLEELLKGKVAGIQQGETSLWIKHKQN